MKDSGQAHTLRALGMTRWEWVRRLVRLRIFSSHPSQKKRDMGHPAADTRQPSLGMTEYFYAG